MEPTLQRPKFLSAFFRTIGDTIDSRGAFRTAPWWIAFCGSLGVGAAYAIPGHFYGHLEVSVVVYVGILTLNALILALSWSAFSRIHELLSGERFGAYLLEHDLLNGYILYIDYVQFTQLFAVICSGVGLVILLAEVSRLLLNQIAFGFIIASVAYSIKTAAAAVSAMHDLVWQKAIFDKEIEDRRAEAANVVRIKKDSLNKLLA